MRSLGLTDGDLDFSVSDRLRSVTERVEQRLRFFRGTWFLRARAGTPLIEDVLTSPANADLAARTLAAAARSVPDVDEVADARVRIGPETEAERFADPRSVRVATATMTIRTQYGDADIEVAV